MVLQLYCLRMSPPSRTVLMTLKCLGLTDVEIINVDTFKEEHLTPQFLAINPQHCVPALVDGDLKIAESRAICTYLISQYGKDDALYPKDAKKRAVVDRFLYFDACTLFQRFLNYAYGKVFEGADFLDPGKLKKLQEGFQMLNTFLDGVKYLAGDHVTVADHAILTTCVSLNAAGMDLSNYPNVSAWMDRCKAEMTYFQEAQEGLETFGTFMKSKITF